MPQRLKPALTRLVVQAVGLLLVAGGLAVPYQALAAAAGQARAANATTARLTITVPHENTILAVDDKMVPDTGTSRTFETPPIARGSTKTLTVVATWDPNTYTTITRRRVLTVKPGEQLNVNLSVDDPNDRVRVMYVPTPFDVADGMVKLAGITANDVAFEPGCGDARVTIAAVKGGAKKAVGIDIDQERVEESRTRVKEAGLADRIEIRLGDALDIKDLSTASVVFLYMGDHFNMLIRPILWRDLKVGARVVSHRFLMGDWKPDKTVTMSSELGGEYELHLWTVTAELKRKLDGQ